MITLQVARLKFAPGRSREGFLYLHHRVKTSSGLHPASYPMGTGDSFPEVKRPGGEADHSPPSSVEVRNTWSYTSTFPYAFMTWYVVKHRDIISG
jgi:hypothetical protein